MTTINDLIKKYSYWGEHERYTESDWEQEVIQRTTRDGYWYWVICQITDEGNNG